MGETVRQIKARLCRLESEAVGAKKQLKVAEAKEAGLKACPCCGSQDVGLESNYRADTGWYRYYLECRNCGLRTRACPRKGDPVRRWNQRQEAQ